MGKDWKRCETCAYYGMEGYVERVPRVIGEADDPCPACNKDAKGERPGYLSASPTPDAEEES